MRVLVTGGSGMLGKSLRRVRSDIADDIELLMPTRAELPLTDRAAVASWYASHNVDAVIHGAARVGGIQANINDPVGFLVENLRINDAVIMGAYEAGVKRLIFLGSSCMYPKDHRQPLVEEDVLAAPLEPTNEGYALSKITGAKLCDYITKSTDSMHYKTLVPCNLFGQDDHFGSEASHLMAAVITKVVAAQQEGLDSVEIWGSGKARREFLDVDVLAAFILQWIGRTEDLPDLLNIGADQDYSAQEYYEMVAELVGWKGRFTHDLSRPEGMMRKLMSSKKAMSLGYQPPQSIKPAIMKAIQAYVKAE